MELLPIRRRACGLGLWGRCSSGKLRMASRSHEAPGPLRSVAVAASQSALSSVVGDRGRAVVCLSLGEGRRRVSGPYCTRMPSPRETGLRDLPVCAAAALDALGAPDLRRFRRAASRRGWCRQGWRPPCRHAPAREREEPNSELGGASGSCFMA